MAGIDLSQLQAAASSTYVPRSAQANEQSAWATNAQDECMEALQSYDLTQGVSALTDQLTEQLVALEKADLHEIAASEEAVLGLVSGLSEVCGQMEGG
jgi:hypothetical protein